VASRHRHCSHCARSGPPAGADERKRHGAVVSMMYSFESPKAVSPHTTQYFEIMGNRGIYHDGWFAGTIHRAPWEQRPRRKLQDDIWELYDTRTDFSLVNNLAAANPAKLKEMQDLFIGATVATGRIEHTQGMVFSADETADVGLDGATPVSTDYKEGDNSFTGKILKVVIDVKPMGVAEKAVAGKALQEAKLKKAISD